MWSKVKTRMISATVLVAILLLAVFFTPEWVFALLVCALSLMVMYELTKVLRLNKKISITLVNYIFAILFMSLQFLDVTVIGKVIFPAVLLYIMLLTAVCVLDNKRVKFSDVCFSVFMVFPLP